MLVCEIAVFPVYTRCVFCLWQILPIRIKCPPLCSRHCSSVLCPRCTDTDGEIDGLFVVTVALYKKISIMDLLVTLVRARFRALGPICDPVSVHTGQTLYQRTQKM